MKSIKKSWKNEFFGYYNKNNNYTSLKLFVDIVKRACKYEILQFMPLFLEIYFMMTHIIIVRFWFLLNITCIFLYLYISLNDSEERKCFNMHNLKEFGGFIILYGIFLLVFFIYSLGIITPFLISYLLYRNYKLLFSK